MVNLITEPRQDSVFCSRSPFAERLVRPTSRRSTFRAFTGYRAQPPLDAKRARFPVAPTAPRSSAELAWPAWWKINRGQ